jgi:cellulose synthase/poly-beta-1,6-N-acetylglucosamine synthase-like glycosyltransferase
MQEKLILLIGWLYTSAAVCLSVFGMNLLLLTILTLYHQRRAGRKPSSAGSPDAGRLPAALPVVTVQLPLYNEQQVARRLIDAVAQLSYPQNCLEIQVLDDSTDETTAIVDERARYWRRRGRWIQVLRRIDRREYKAGALRAGLERAAGDFIAIFDADFVPQPDWLQRALPPFFEPGSEHIGLVQTRWGHLNEEYSLLTRAQALALDGHFMVEQNGRHAAGLFLTFNGTAGIWRRACIEAAGSWRGETLSEDLDLSYRAQLRGWKICYCPEIAVPAEIPILMTGLKRQQFRWAKGTIQVARLLGPEILRAPLDPWHKLQGLLHLTAYISHPLMVLVLLTMLPLHLEGSFFRHSPALILLGAASIGSPLLYAVSQALLYGRGSLPSRWLARMPLLFLLGVGIAANNTRAVLEALFGVRTPFERTPKSGVMRRDRHWRRPQQGERIKVNATTWFELFLGLYSGSIAALMLSQGDWASASFAILAALGFAWVCLASLWEARRI